MIQSINHARQFNSKMLVIRKWTIDEWPCLPSPWPQPKLKTFAAHSKRI
jgi:hypothetical protein